MARWTAWPLAALAIAALLSGPVNCAETVTEASSSGTPPVDAAGSGGGGGGAGGGAGGGEEDAGVDAAPMCPDCSLVEVPQCFTSVCDQAKGECVAVPTKGDEPCDDGLFCTLNERCKNGVCGEGSDNFCGLTGDACHGVVCDEEADACSLSALPDGISCVSEDLCVVNATCAAGVCTGAQKDCFFAPVPDACHVSACNAATGKCEPVPGNDGAACPNDGDPCLLQKKCSGGLCQGGVPKNCSALTSPCNVGVCDAQTGECKKQPFGVGDSCLDAVNECNTGMCDANGACVPVPTPGVACASATNDCNEGKCDAAGVCVGSPVNEAGACEDGNACTTGETCSAGACAGGVLNNYIVYFSESFADNSAGWTFNQPGMPATQEWQIGPAAASSCQNSGSGDPATDHTDGTGDNGIAGVAIGGCPLKALHGYYYLESPAFNGEVMGSVWLEFWRFLNSDYAPYMRNTIEVWSGAAWAKVWESAGPPALKDAAWTRFTYDLTPWKNAAMRVRFGWQIQNTTGFTVSGWNIDDVVISNAICD
jgi:hypothetical protein